MFSFLLDSSSRDSLLYEQTSELLTKAEDGSEWHLSETSFALSDTTAGADIINGDKTHDLSGFTSEDNARHQVSTSGAGFGAYMAVLDVAWLAHPALVRRCPFALSRRWLHFGISKRCVMRRQGAGRQQRHWPSRGPHPPACVTPSQHRMSTRLNVCIRLHAHTHEIVARKQTASPATACCIWCCGRSSADAADGMAGRGGR